MRKLVITHHALERLAEAMGWPREKIPKKAGSSLNLQQVAGVSVAVKMIFPILWSARRVTLPDRKEFWKMLRHGIKEHYFFQATVPKYRKIIFNIVREKDRDTVVTIVNLPDERVDKDKPVETGPNQTGMEYFGNISGFHLPYSLSRRAADKYDGDVCGVQEITVPIIFRNFNPNCITS